MLYQSLNQFQIKIKITTTTKHFQKNSRIHQLKNNHKNSFPQYKISREKSNQRTILCCKKTNWDVNINNIVISKLTETKANSKHLIGYLDKAIRPLVSIKPKMSGYAKTFKVEDKSSKLMSFPVDDEKLLEKYRAIWTKIEDLKNIKLNALSVYDDRYIKTKIRTYGVKPHFVITVTLCNT